MKILYISINVGKDHPLRACVTETIDPYPDLDLSRILCLSTRIERELFHDVVDGTLGQYPDDVSDVCGLVIGCSGHSFDFTANDAAPWQQSLIAFIRNCISREIPYLGLCGGGQAGLVALGGKVRPNPAGTGTFSDTPGSIRMGASELRLYEAARDDVLFSGVDTPVVMSALHSDHMSEIPDDPRFTVLAGDDLFPIQVVRFGNNAWMFGVHPEMTKEFVRRSSQKALNAGGFAVADRNDVEYAFETMHPTEAANARIIENFIFDVCLGATA